MEQHRLLRLESASALLEERPAQLLENQTRDGLAATLMQAAKSDEPEIGCAFLSCAQQFLEEKKWLRARTNQTQTMTERQKCDSARLGHCPERSPEIWAAPMMRPAYKGFIRLPEAL